MDYDCANLTNSPTMTLEPYRVVRPGVTIWKHVSSVSYVVIAPDIKPITGLRAISVVEHHMAHFILIQRPVSYESQNELTFTFMKNRSFFTNSGLYRDFKAEFPSLKSHSYSQSGYPHLSETLAEHLTISDPLDIVAFKLKYS